jgi:glycosyl transferase family 25
MSKRDDLRVFVISLERATERREYMADLVSRLGLTAEFVSAVDGKQLSPEQRARYSSRRARRIYGCEMTDSEIGCYMSHLAIYNRMIEEDIETVLVLEDDISCVADLRGVLDEVIRLPRDAWQVIRLQSSKTSITEPANGRGQGERIVGVGERDIYRIRTSILGGCAYLIRRPAAEAMLLRSGRIDMPIDQTLDRYWENGIVPYVLRPTPVWHEDLFASEIGQRGRGLVNRQPAGVVFRRRMQRLLDSLNKRIFWLAFRVPSVGSVMSRFGVGSARMALRALWGSPTSVSMSVKA